MTWLFYIPIEAKHKKMALVAYTKTETIALVDALPQLTNDPSPKDEQTVTVPCEDKLTQIADRSSIISEEKNAKSCNDKLLTPKYSALAENKKTEGQTCENESPQTTGRNSQTENMQYTPIDEQIDAKAFKEGLQQNKGEFPFLARSRLLQQ